MENREIKNLEPIVKKYTFSKEEQTALQDIQIAMISFQQAVNGMQMNKDILLMQAYKRCGIGEKDGYTKSISYRINPGEITVTYTPKEEELAKK